MNKPDRQKFTAGMVLVLLGIGIYLVQRFQGIGNELVMLIIGSAFLVGYFYQKAYGLLIPSGILLGLGAGGLLDERLWWAKDGSLFGLGVGFLSIYVISRLYERDSHWWPIIPGGILLVVGLGLKSRPVRILIDNWPLILVAIGLLILIGAFRRSPDRDPEHQPPPPAPPPRPDETVEPKVE